MPNHHLLSLNFNPLMQMHALYRSCQRHSFAFNRLKARKIQLLSGSSYRWIAIPSCQFFGHCQSVGNRIPVWPRDFLRLPDYLYGRPCCNALASRGGRRDYATRQAPIHSSRRPIQGAISIMVEAALGVLSARIGYAVRPRQAAAARRTKVACDTSRPTLVSRALAMYPCACCAASLEAEERFSVGSIWTESGAFQ